ncbi:MAG TPA: DNA polymerase III subunit epsilon [Gammaproteobacteria bacterium]|nr:DNA polymerase III subunit epsilon [Gammaproteobacteria bacterium]
MRQVVLDTETTGLNVSDGHRIIEVAGVELVNRRLTGRHYHQYIRPQRKIDAEAQAIHGITETFLADKPLFHEIAGSLLEFIQGAELVIHNAPFDITFLNSELLQSGAQYKQIADYCTTIDTLVLARKKHPGQQNSLDALCRRYSVDNSNRTFHGALLDAHLLATVYLAMTGGQTTLFGETAVTESKETQVESAFVPVSQNTWQLKVIKASSEELKLHHQRLEAIKQISGGACLWDTL